MGKRQGRALLAHWLRDWHNENGVLTDTLDRNYDEVIEALSDQDPKALNVSRRVLKTFEETIARNTVHPWCRVDATRRHAARMQIVRALTNYIKSLT